MLNLDQIQRVFEPRLFPPGWLIDAMFNDFLMKITIWETVESVRHEANVIQPATEVFNFIIGDELPSCAGGEPQADTHPLVGSYPSLHSQRIAFQAGPHGIEIGPGMNVGAIAHQ